MVKRMCEICSECSKQCSMTWLLAPVVLCVGLRSWSVQPFQQLIKRSKAHAVEIVVGQSKALAFSHSVPKTTIPQRVQILLFKY